MGRLSEPGKTILLRELIYGPSQTKKTFWAGKAAEAGYNVVLLTGDGHFQVLFNLEESAQERVTVLNVSDKVTSPQFAYAVTTVLKAKAPLIWNDTRNEQLFRTLHDEDEHIVLDVRKLDHNFILVIDSWTALVDSILLDFANEQSIDLSDGSKIEWDLYGPCNRLATWILQQLKGLPCHVIVIGHSTMWEKRKGGKGPDKNDIVETRQQIISTSGNHSKLLPGHFSETLLFGITGNNNNWVDSRPSGSRDSGSRTLCKRADWDSMQFKHFAEASKCVTPDPEAAKSCEGLQFMKGEDLPAELKPKVRANLSLNAGKGAAVAAKLGANQGPKTGLSGVKPSGGPAAPKKAFAFGKKKEK